ncbi:MAG: nitroreductase family protein [Flavobacteriales bacterium]
MNFLDLANSRYTTKKYNPTEKIPEDKIQQLKEILRLSPSSINSQPWKFLFISDENLKRALAAVSYFNEPKINNASHFIVFTAIDDVQLFEEHVRQNLPEGSLAYYNLHLKSLPDAEIKSWLQHQVYLALGFFLSACASMGIDSTPMEGIKTEEYTKILQLKGYKTLFAVAIGYRDAEDKNQPSVKPKSRMKLEDVVQVI